MKYALRQFLLHALPAPARKGFLGLSLLFLGLGATQRSQAQIVVQDSIAAAAMVQNLVGTGITFLNPTLTCSGKAAGTYQIAGTSNLGIDSGLVLTTGVAQTDPVTGDIGVNGAQQIFFPATCDPTGSGGSDNDLSTLAGVATFDACVLEFDFVPDGDSLLFDYVFGSEEYDNFSCSGFNDVFAFFLSGPGIVGSQNLALIPGTTIPVSINSTTDPTVTQPFSTAQCAAMGAGSPFAQYYNDNQAGTSITYYGLTQVLTARAQVIPCTTYHIKLAVADGGDCTLDSGVFLESNSFRSTNIKLKLNSSLGSDFDYLVEGCSRGSIAVQRPKVLPISQTIYLTYGGTATRNVDYFNVPDSVVIPFGDTTASFNIDPIFDGVVEGTEVIQVNVINACNGIIIDSIFFDVEDYLPSQLYSDDTGVCQYTGKILLHVGDDDRFDWFWRNNLSSGTIDDPTAMRTYATVDTSVTFSVSASLVNPFGTCYTDTSEFDVTIEPKPIVTILNPDTTLCMRDPFQFRVDVGPKWFTDYNYVWVPNLYLDDPFAKEPFFFNQDFRMHRYVLTAQTPLGCQGSDTSELIRTRPPLDLVNITPETTIRYGDSIRLNVDSGDYYVWTSPFSLDNENIQDPVARPKESTLYTVYAWNRYGCRDTGFVKINVDFAMAEFIPSAFSPNGDGKNDVFRIFNLRYQKITEFRIFNRWGQEVYGTTNTAEGWNGRNSHTGEPADMGVYQYLIRTVRPDGTPQLYKGDVMLMR